MSVSAAQPALLDRARGAYPRTVSVPARLGRTVSALEARGLVRGRREGTWWVVQAVPPPLQERLRDFWACCDGRRCCHIRDRGMTLELEVAGQRVQLHAPEVRELAEALLVWLPGVPGQTGVSHAG